MSEHFKMFTMIFTVVSVLLLFSALLYTTVEFELDPISSDAILQCKLQAYLMCAI